MADRALVLNASYEPLGIVSSHRAVALVLNDKATMLEAGDELFRAESRSLKCHSG
jgi:hypothetical protein